MTHGRKTHDKSKSIWDKNAKNNGVEKQEWTKREGVGDRMVRGQKKGEVGRRQKGTIQLKFENPKFPVTKKGSIWFNY